MGFLAEARIGIECNLTSNVQTSRVADYPSHPMKEFLERGLLATLNTDNPAVGGNDLPYEYEVAAPAAGLSTEQIHQAQRYALEVAFLSPNPVMLWITGLSPPLPKTASHTTFYKSRFCGRAHRACPFRQSGLYPPRISYQLF